MASPECLIGNFKIHIEFPILMMFFAFAFKDSVSSNFILYRTCYVSLGYSENECALLGKQNQTNETIHLENIVQPYASVLLMTQVVINAIVPSILCLFLGSWSDTNGRKPILLLGPLGMMFSYLFLTVLASFPNLSPWWLIVCDIPTILVGGFCTYISACLCYISDVTPIEKRGMRMGLFEASLAVGMLFGTLSSSYILYASSYATIYSASAGCLFVAFLFTYLLIPESVEVQDNPHSLFEMSHIKEMFKTCIKQREENKRTILFLTIMIMIFYILCINSESSLVFLYLRDKLHWTLEKYNLFTSANSVIWIFGTIAGISVLHKLLGVKEVPLLILGFITLSVSSCIQGFANRDWHIYAAGGVRCFGGLVSPMSRSLLSKIIPSEELGKVFALLTAGESLTPLFMSPLYTYVYNSTLNSFPGTYNFISAMFYLINVILCCAIVRIQVKNYYQSLVTIQTEE